jgi:hypothetical protein
MAGAAVVAAQWRQRQWRQRQHGGSSQVGGGGGNLAEAQLWRQLQCFGKRGGSAGVVTRWKISSCVCVGGQIFEWICWKKVLISMCDVFHHMFYEGTRYKI